MYSVGIANKRDFQHLPWIFLEHMIAIHDLSLMYNPNLGLDQQDITHTTHTSRLHIGNSSNYAILLFDKFHQYTLSIYGAYF